MFMSILNTSLKAIFALSVCCCWLLALDTTALARAQTSVLTVVLRDLYSQPIEAAGVEVLSYDWGLQPGQPYSVIARGETNAEGAAAFDVTAWPRSGYRFRFTKTERTKPQRTYFEPQALNQYRGHPAAVVGGGGGAGGAASSEQHYFVIAGDGLVYNDLSGGTPGKAPNYRKDPVGGLEKPRVTLMPAEAYLSTAVAATAEAAGRGEPSPTRPPRPASSPAPGTVQMALPVVPNTASTTLTGGAGTSTTNTLATAIITAQVNSTPNAVTTPGGSVAARRREQEAQTGANSFARSVLLALVGVGCFVVFWRYRKRLYPWLGIEATSTTTANTTTSKRAGVASRPLRQKRPVVTTAEVRKLEEAKLRTQQAEAEKEEKEKEKEEVRSDNDETI